MDVGEDFVFKTEVQPFRFDAGLDDERVHVRTNFTRTVHLNITNTGGVADTYAINLSYDDCLQVRVNPTEFSLDEGKGTEAAIQIISHEQGVHSLWIEINSAGGAEEKSFEVEVISQEAGVDVYPDSYIMKAGQDVTGNVRLDFRIKNLGVEEDTFTVTIDAASVFKPMVYNLDNWIWGKNRGWVTLDPGESRRIEVDPLLLTMIEDTYFVNITVKSESRPNLIYEHAEIVYQYKEVSLGQTGESYKYVDWGGKVNYSFTLEGLRGEEYELKLTLSHPEWNVSLYILENDTGRLLLNGEGSLDLGFSGNTTIDLYLVVEEGGNTDPGDVATTTVSVINPGVTPSFGAWKFIVGTFLVTIGAIAIAVPLGLGMAIFIAELAGPKLRMFLKSSVEILAGIPSVVYGFFGLVVLAGWLRVSFDLSSGECWAAASILLGIMALPTIVSVSEDAVSSVPHEFKEASLGMGATRWQTISKVIVPSSMSGITAAVILGMGRAMGETMAVMMVAGNSNTIPSPITDVFDPVRPLTAVIGTEMGEASGTHLNALFALGIILFFIVLVVNSIANYVMEKMKQKFKPKTKIRKKLLSDARSRAFKKWTGRVFKSFLALVVLAVLRDWFGLMWTGVLVLAFIGLYFLFKKTDPKAVQKIAFGMIVAAALTVIAMLTVIIYHIVANGIDALSWEFLTQSPENLGREGGIYPAIVGTLYLVGGAILVAVPIGICAGIYLAEYGKEGWIKKVIRAGIDNLNATPSIVFGLFAFSFFVTYLKWGISLLTGQFILGFLILPTIIRTTEEAVKAVPWGFREGSLALGATKWQTIRKVVLPPGSPGIITGTILSIGRAAGETAPILFTAVIFTSAKLPTSVQDRVMALPTHLFLLITSVPGKRAVTNAYGTALVLLLLVMAIYSVAIVLRAYYWRKMKY